MEILNFLHERLSYTTLYFMVALGVWGLWNALRGGMTPSYWGGIVIGQILLVIQVLIGVLLLFGAWPARGWLHILYGIAIVISFPAAFAFTRGQSSRYEALIYALVALFLAGMALRAWETGGGY
jgi:hypothetical protein